MAIRAFVDEHIRPDAADIDEKGSDIPLELNKKLAGTHLSFLSL
jgi:hypothetical protein